MGVLKRIDSVIITESNKEYMRLYNFTKFCLKAGFYWLCFRTGAFLVILLCLNINKDAAFQESIKDGFPWLSSTASFIDSIFLFTFLLILLALFYICY